MADAEPTKRPTAEPITAVLADRLRELRERSGMSQADLAERMTKLGIPWTRATVVNLEKRGITSRKRSTAAGRDAVTVQELLALALVFNVPLVWLLADPEAGRAVPIAEGVEVDPWTALMWLTGLQPLEGSGKEGVWGRARGALEALGALAESLGAYHQNRETFDYLARTRLAEGQTVVKPGMSRKSLDDLQRWALESAAIHLGNLLALGLPALSLSPDVRKRAAELGIELPGQEG